MAHYTVKNFWVDALPDDSTSKRKHNIVQLSEMIDIISSEFAPDGQIITRAIPSKEYKPSPETHKERKERVEHPYIIAKGKPAKRKDKRVPFVKIYSSPVTDGQIIGDKTPLEHGMTDKATLAGNERDNCPTHKRKKVR